MAHTELTGVQVALVTPFTADGSEIDVAALDAHVDRMIREGVQGLVPGGSSGEFTTLTIDERKQLTELVVKAAAGRVPVVAGTGALSTKDNVELAVHAAQAGADALMIVPPFYEAPDLDAFKGLLREVYAAAQLPIMYYNIPSVSGLSLTPAEIASLADVEGVRYLKDTSGNAPALTELRCSTPTRSPPSTAGTPSPSTPSPPGRRARCGGRRTSSPSCPGSCGTPSP